MRSEIEAYFIACGEDIDDEAISDQIDGYLSQMTDASDE